MLLADMGAEVVRIDRISDQTAHPHDFTLRGRRSVALNLKSPAAIETALALIASADGLIEGFRSGVMERLGLGPEACLARNPRLVYGRMTGWGQTGPWAKAAGHDLNYIALTGALWASGPADRKPPFPMNLLGDFGGGGTYLAFGMLAAMLQAQRTGQGDVIDAAICDGTNSLMTFIQAMRATGNWTDTREANLLDGGVPWYGVYVCADGKWISIGALEPQFWACLLDLLGLDPSSVGDRSDPATYPETRALLERTFAAHPRSHWDARLGGTDACYAPVLSPAEARDHPQMKARRAFADKAVDEPVPAPRFASCDPLPPVALPRDPGADTVALLTELGFDKGHIDDLISQGAVGAAKPRNAAE